MKNLFSLSRSEKIIFFSGLAATCVFIVIYFFSGNASHPLASIASDSYAPLAVSIYESGTFTLSTSSPFILEATHVPGYPLFLAAIAAPFGSVIPALIIQALLFSFSAVLLYRLFEGTFSERVRFFGALLFTIEPYTAFTAAQPLSEALFLFLFICGLYVGRKAIEKISFRLFFLSGFFLSAATLTRPILLYLLPLLLLSSVILVYKKSPKRALLSCVAGAFGILLVLAPWFYRNYETFGVWTLSTKSAYTLYFYDAALLLQYRDGISGLEANTRLFNLAKEKYPELRTTDDMRSPIYADFMNHESMSIIRTAPIQFTKMYLASICTFFFSDGYRLLWIESSGESINLPNITKSIMTGQAGMLVNYLLSQPLQALLFALGFVFWSLVFLLSFFSFLSSFPSSSRHRVVLWSCVAVVIYFAILTGPVAQARYRVVVTPFLFMLASFGWSILLTVITRYFVSHDSRTC